MESDSPSRALTLAHQIAAKYAALPQVEAVALSGSQTNRVADDRSDIDLYVYVREDIPLEERARIAKERSTRADIDNRFAEPGEEWIDADLDIGVDVMFRHLDWIEAQLARVLERHEPSNGYSTAFWHNVHSSEALFDRNGWFQRLQETASQPYPEPLRRAIARRNHLPLRNIISSTYYQLTRAAERNDLVAVNHRVTAILANYFDILFAVNRMPHPGEKRQLQLALERCDKLPAGMEAHVNGLILAIPKGKDELSRHANQLLDALDDLLKSEGLF
jgi:predicted nucleotidyltransferase